MTHNTPHTFHPSILRAYDIRGTFTATLFVEDAILLGQKIASYLRTHKTPEPLTVGLVRDGRISSPLLHNALKETLLELGIHIIDFGVGPSPMGYFAHATHTLDGLIVVTASHNPKEDNGFKILLKGKNLCGEELLTFASLPTDLPPAHERGSLTYHDIKEAYVRFCADSVTKESLPPLKIAWDFSHGAMAVMADLMRHHIPGQHFYACDTVDGHFPIHDPDPTNRSNLKSIQNLIRTHQCDLGFIFDGDGDRLVVLDHTGEPIDGDRLVVFLAHDVLRTHPKATILSDIKASITFQEGITHLGGTPLLSRTGHSFIKTKIKQTGALLAGEMSGHIFFADESYGYDDGLYAACRFLRLLGRFDRTAKEFEDRLPRYAITPEYKLKLPAYENPFFKFDIITSLQHYLRTHSIPFLDEDGIRLEQEKGWWLLRASNTENCLILRLEGRDHTALEGIKDHYKKCIERGFPSGAPFLINVL